MDPEPPQPKLAILTYSNYSDEAQIDDVVLREAVTRRGLAAEIVVWDNPDIDFSEFSHAIVRSTWDYDQRAAEFISFLEKLESDGVVLFNPLELMRANTDKRYLTELAKPSLNVVPTIFIDPQTFALTDLTNDGVDHFSFSCLQTALDHTVGVYDSFEYLIIKPTQSASGKHTVRVPCQDRSAINEAVATIPAYAAIMVQPYLDMVETHGERSTVVIEGQACFTMKKVPAEGGFLVHTEHGGTYTPTELEPADTAFIDSLIANLETVPLYMRVDYVCDSRMNRMLLELELVEPYLYLNKSALALNKLADALSHAAKQPG